MGGDRSPEVIARGAIEAAKNRSNQLRIVLVGDEEGIRSALSRIDQDSSAIDIVHAPESIGMSESPATAIAARKTPRSQ
jgi:glycerol-3-phosphate acyltransferase PlsX